jgi:Spx/MgsR family transcriptional regulator
MTTPKIYGIKNCDTVRKALKWLEANNIAYDFHDYKKLGVDEKAFNKAVKKHGWENVINRRSPSWRKIPKEQQDSMNESNAINSAQENTSLIKRPMLIYGDEIILGFDENAYRKIF